MRDEKAPPTPEPRAQGDARAGDGHVPVIELRQYLAIVARRKWLMLGVLVSILAITVVQLQTMTPLYRSTTIIQIHETDAKILPYEEVLGKGSSRSFRGEDIRTQAKKLRTRSLARRVIIDLELAEDPVFNTPVKRGILRDWPKGLLDAARRALSEESDGESAGPDDTSVALDFAVRTLLGRLDVEPLRNTRLIQLSYESSDPVQAMQVVNKIADEFIEEDLRTRFNATTKATEFLQKQLHGLQARVEESEQRSLEYLQTQEGLGLGERERIAREKLEDLNDGATAAEALLIQNQARHDAVLAAPLGRFPEILRDSTIRELEHLHSELETEKAALTGRFGSAWPDTRELEQRLESLRTQLELEKKRARQSVQEEYEMALGHHRSLSKALDRQTALVDQINEDLIQYNILRREVETNNQVYETLLQRMKEAGVSAGLRSSNITIADEAVVPESRSSPNKSRAVAMAIGVGLLLAIAAAFLMENLDTSIKNLKDVTLELGLPALGYVPHLAVIDDPDLASESRSQAEAERHPIIAYQGADRFQARDWEAYRSLRTSILLSHSGSPPQVIMATSALPSEGKSTTAANLAIALSQVGGRTVLLDLDLRKPALSKAFGFTGTDGLSSFLSGNSPLPALVQETPYPGLFVIASGPPAPNPPELIASDRMASGLEQLRRDFDWVVIDTPPSLEFTDARVASPHVDGVIIVARSHKTPKECVKRVFELFSNVGTKILGVVLNDLADTSSEYDYAYYSNYYDVSPPARSVDSPRRRSRRGK